MVSYDQIGVSLPLPPPPPTSMVLPLHYTRNCCTIHLYFLKICLHHCMALLQVVLLHIIPHKFVCHAGINDCRELKSIILG
jgi:hypothetical protein